MVENLLNKLQGLDDYLIVRFVFISILLILVLILFINLIKRYKKRRLQKFNFDVNSCIHSYESILDKEIKNQENSTIVNKNVKINKSIIDSNYSSNNKFNNKIVTSNEKLKSSTVVESIKHKEESVINKFKIPTNPITTFVNAGVEEYDKIKYIGYKPLTIEIDIKNPTYPMVFMPKANSVIKFPRKGKQGVKGYTEDYFINYIVDCFNEFFKIYDDRFVLQRSNQNPYEPDIVLVDESDGINLFIDIEIDEPYDGISRQPTHYLDYDRQRNLFFNNRGWVVVRFAEYQVCKDPMGCCRLILDIIKNIDSKYDCVGILKDVKSIAPIAQWTKDQAILWEKEGYRERYLGIDKFNKNNNRIVLKNLNESKIGEQIESQVINDGFNDFRFLSINSAIKNRLYLSCKISNNNTVIKPLNIINSKLTAYCYLKNEEINIDIDDISNIVERDSPFLCRYNEADGDLKFREVILNFINRINPIRIKYEKCNFGSYEYDIETGEIITDMNLISLRTLTDFNVASKVLTEDKIDKYRLNDFDYISGFCHLRNESRTFKYSRIKELEILNV